MTAPIGIGHGTTFRHAPALDGLRGIAVAAVVVYHIWPDALPGGFVGVDVFFVLSGFLLSALLVREVESTGRVALGRFFVRRVRRLLPATLLVLLALAGHALTWADPAELERLREHTIGALTYSINWLFIVDGTTYTDVVLGASPLRHMWSLAIEEQFYVVLAVAMAVLARSDRSVVRRRLGIGAFVLAGVSAAEMIVLQVLDVDAARLYFGSDTRAQAMSIGVGLGALLGDRLLDARTRTIAPIARPVAVVATVAGLGVLAVVAAVAAEDATWMFLGGFSVVAVAAGLLVVGVLSSDRVGGVFAVPPLVGLGTISYGVYLWHWPVLVILDDERLSLDGWALAGAQIAITLAVSVVSYGLVEQPIRAGALGRVLGRPALLVAPLAVLAVGAATVYATVPDDTPGRADEVAVVGQSPDDPAISDPTRFQIAALGDSVMHTLIGGRLGTGLQAVPWNQEQSSFDTSEVAVTTIARPACSFLPGLVAFEEPGGYETADLSPPCLDWRGDLDRAVHRAVPADVTIVMPSNDLEDRELDGEIVPFGSVEWEDLVIDWIAEVTGIAQAGGSTVVLLAPAPRIDPNWSTPQGVREARIAEIFEVFALANPGVESIDLGDFVGAGSDMRDDGLHYTREGAEAVAAWLTPQLVAFATLDG